jgi:hypothetical protein
MDDRLEQLMFLRGLTMRTGAIHEAQALQLRNYPILIKGIVASTVKINVENKTIEYIIKKTTKDFVKGKKFDFEAANVKKCVQTLLWPDAVVTMKRSGKVIYDSRK